MRGMQRTEHSCGAVVFREGCGTRQVLLICSQRGAHWSFPKGHVEKGETRQQTALREVEEETGIRARLLEGGVLQRRYYPLPDGNHKRVEYFLAEGQGTPRPQEGETSQAVWIEAEKAFARLSFRGDRQLLRRALMRLDGLEDGG